MTKRRRSATERIESGAARSVCFCKRRKGLFKKAEELTRLNPNISIAAVVFSPSGAPYSFGDTSSLFPRYLAATSPSSSSTPSSVNSDDDECIRTLLGFDISDLDKAQLHSYKSQLLHLKSLLLKTNNNNNDLNTVIPHPSSSKQEKPPRSSIFSDKFADPSPLGPKPPVVEYQSENRDNLGLGKGSQSTVIGDDDGASVSFSEFGVDSFGLGVDEVFSSDQMGPEFLGYDENDFQNLPDLGISFELDGIQERVEDYAVMTSPGRFIECIDDQGFIDFHDLGISFEGNMVEDHSVSVPELAVNFDPEFAREDDENSGEFGIEGIEDDEIGEIMRALLSDEGAPTLAQLGEDLS